MSPRSRSKSPKSDRDARSRSRSPRQRQNASRNKRKTRIVNDDLEEQRLARNRRARERRQQQERDERAIVDRTNDKIQSWITLWRPWCNDGQLDPSPSTSGIWIRHDRGSEPDVYSYGEVVRTTVWDLEFKDARPRKHPDFNRMFDSSLHWVDVIVSDHRSWAKRSLNIGELQQPQHPVLRFRAPPYQEQRFCTGCVEPNALCSHWHHYQMTLLPTVTQRYHLRRRQLQQLSHLLLGDLWNVVNEYGGPPLVDELDEAGIRANDRCYNCDRDPVVIQQREQERLAYLAQCKAREEHERLKEVEQMQVWRKFHANKASEQLKRYAGTTVGLATRACQVDVVDVSDEPCIVSPNSIPAKLVAPVLMVRQTPVSTDAHTFVLKHVKLDVSVIPSHLSSSGAPQSLVASVRCLDTGIAYPPVTVSYQSHLELPGHWFVPDNQYQLSVSWDQLSTVVPLQPYSAPAVPVSKRNSSSLAVSQLSLDDILRLAS